MMGILRASDKSKKGRLTESGRKRINAETGSNLKTPVTARQAETHIISSKTLQDITLSVLHSLKMGFSSEGTQ